MFFYFSILLAGNEKKENKESQAEILERAMNTPNYNEDGSIKYNPIYEWRQRQGATDNDVETFLKNYRRYKAGEQNSSGAIVTHRTK